MVGDDRRPVGHDGGDPVIEVVRRCFAEWHADDLDALLALYDENVELDATAFGEGVYRGQAEVRRFLEGIRATTSGTSRHEDLRLHEGADGRVAVTATLVGTGAISSARISAPIGFIYEVSRGRVARIAFQRDPTDALRAVGLPAATR